MTLVVAVLVPGGVAISGDSRALLEYYDNEERTVLRYRRLDREDAVKVHQLNERIGAASYGEYLVGDVEVGQHLKDLLLHRANNPQGLRQFSQTVSEHFQSLTTHVLGLLLAGYEAGVPLLLQVEPSGRVRQLYGRQEDGGLSCGFIVEGDLPAAQWLRKDPEFGRNWASTTLEEAIAFTQAVIQITIERMRCGVELSSVGGHVRSLTVTPEGCRMVQ